MKIRCIKKDKWLTVGLEYVVLGIYGRESAIKYRIIADDGHTPALQDANLFELSLPDIPVNWIFRVYPASEWELTPAAWAKEGFWTAYFDGDAAAAAAFSKVKSTLYL